MKSFRNNGRKVHVLTVVKDGENEIMLVKYWRSDKKRWEYNASTMTHFETFKVGGLITDIKV